MLKTDTLLNWEKSVASRKRKARRLRQEEMARLGVVQPSYHKLIPLLKGKFAKVDNEDFEKLNEFFWRLDHSGYVASTIDRKTVFMHRLLMNIPDGMEIDHINRCKSDNRRSNLRICTKTQNSWNSPKRGNKTSKYKGVHYCKHRKAFYATGNGLRIGVFQNEIDAAKKYNEFALSNFGEFACINKFE